MHEEMRMTEEFTVDCGASRGIGWCCSDVERRRSEDVEVHAHAAKAAQARRRQDADDLEDELRGERKEWEA